MKFKDKPTSLMYHHNIKQCKMVYVPFNNKRNKRMLFENSIDIFNKK